MYVTTHIRYPVYGNDIDQVIGIFILNIAWSREPENNILKIYIRALICK